MTIFELATDLGKAIKADEKTPIIKVPEMRSKMHGSSVHPKEWPPQGCWK